MLNIKSFQITSLLRKELTKLSLILSVKSAGNILNKLMISKNH